MKSFIILLSLVSLNVCSQVPIIRSITGYGASAGSGVLNTSYIQKAIDEVSSLGGGTVIVPAGVFITSTIELKSGVTLFLEQGAVLRGSVKRADYQDSKPLVLIYAKGQHHIAIAGNGTLDGQGKQLLKDIFKGLEEGSLTDPEWKTKRPVERNRSNLIYFEGCTGVHVTGIFLKDASSWVTHYARCRNVLIDHIRLESTSYWNNDGIDIVDCRNVRITNSSINSSDDAICLKSSTKGEFCDSIYIDSCTLRSSANAFKLGTASVGGFRNITVRNLTVFDTFRSAIALEAVDGGFLENIDIRNITAKNTGNAIFIKLGHRNNDKAYSTVKNIYIANVKVDVPADKPDAGYEMEGPLLRYPKGIVPVNGKFISVSPWNNSSPDPDAIIYKHNVFPSSISGLPGHPVENVTLENIEITYEGGADKDVNYFPVHSFKRVTEAEKAYPEFSMFGELPAWGFYVRHVKGITYNNVQLNLRKRDYRVACIFDDVKNIRLEKINIPFCNTLPPIILNNVSGYSEKGLRVPVKIKGYK